ncbi:MAG: anhydro-N-acetylmuramic acid kinase, partial [Alphaproteobacteria bacterium]
MEHVRAIGLMSGTSLDGVDVALIETDGENIAGFGPTACRPYTPPERELLRRALVDAAGLADRNARPGVLKEAEALVTETHAQAAGRFLRDEGLGKDVAVVGFHGQTVLHRPDAGLSVQLGDG